MSIHTRGLHPVVREAADWVIRYAEDQGVPVTVTSGFRSWEEQAQLRAKWLRGENPYPANRPGDSSHNWGLGWDSWVPPEYQQFWNDLRSWIGFTIYPERDKVHAEYPEWRLQVKGWPRPTEQGWR